MDVKEIKSGLNDLKDKGGFVALINEKTSYTYRHVHNFLTIENYNVTINFLQDMQDLIKNKR